MLVINRIQTGLRLYCAWIGKTIAPGCIGSDRQPRFEIVLISIESFKVKTADTHFRLASWSWACNNIYTKPWRIYVSNQTKFFWSQVLSPFLKPAQVFSKDYTIIQMKALWCESCGFERNNNVLTSSPPPTPKGMVRLVEASVSVGWLD